MPEEYSDLPPAPSETGFSPSFLVLYVLLLIPSAGLWFFYRSLFQDDASVLGMVALTAITAWFWAALVGTRQSSSYSG